MCPPACTDPEEQRTLNDCGLTGNLISTFLGVTCSASRPHPAPVYRACAARFTPGLDRRLPQVAIQLCARLFQVLWQGIARLKSAAQL